MSVPRNWTSISAQPSRIQIYIELFVYSIYSFNVCTFNKCHLIELDTRRRRKNLSKKVNIIMHSSWLGVIRIQLNLRRRTSLRTMHSDVEWDMTVLTGRDTTIPHSSSFGRNQTAHHLHFYNHSTVQFIIPYIPSDFPSWLPFRKWLVDISNGEELRIKMACRLRIGQ